MSRRPRPTTALAIAVACTLGINLWACGDIDTVSTPPPSEISIVPEIAEGVVPYTPTFTVDTGDWEPTTYRWDFGDEQTETVETASVSHTYDQTGTFTASVSVTDGISTLNASRDVQVFAASFVVTIDAQPASGAAPLVVSFSAAADEARFPVEYVWAFGTDGATSVEADPTFTYDQAGSYDVTLTVTDANGIEEVGSTTIAVEVGNGTPDAADDSASVDEDGEVLIDVLLNDSDPDEDELSISDVTDPSNGTTELVDGQVRYAPDPDYFGADAFIYTVADGRGGEDTASVAVAVSNVNDVPVPRNDAVTTLEDTAISIAVVDNDVDADEDPLTIASFGDEAELGTLVISGDSRSIVYTPQPDVSGEDSFTYRVTDGSDGGTATGLVEVTIDPVNDLPTLTNTAQLVPRPNSPTITDDIALATQPTTHDAEGDSVTFNYVWEGRDSAVGGDFAEVASDQDVTTIAALSADLTEQLYTYRLRLEPCDPTDCNAEFTTGTVTVGNTAPLITEAIAIGPTPAFTDDDLVVTPSQPATFDEDGDPVSYNFQWQWRASAGEVWTDLTGESGADQSAIGSLPAVATRRDLQYRVWAAAFDQLTEGDRSFSDPLMVSNTGPLGTDDSGLTVEEDGTLVIPAGQLTSNDTDQDEDALGIASANYDGDGTLTPSTSGGLITALTYQPPADFSGSETLDYTVTDGDLTDTATVTIDVTAVNDDPVIERNLVLNVGEGQTVTVSTGRLDFSDVDNERDEIVVNVGTPPSDGQLLIDDDPFPGAITFTAQDLSDGRISYEHGGIDDDDEDSFVFSVVDGAGGTAGPASFTIAVTEGDDPPMVSNNGLTVTEGGGATIGTAALSASDPDTAAGLLIFTVTVLPNYGEVQLGGAALDENDFFSQADIVANVVSYEHFGAEEDSDELWFTLSDGTTTLDAAPFAIEVEASNDAPLVQNQSLTLDEATTVTLGSDNLLATDDDNTPSQISFEVQVVPAHGQLRRDGTLLSAEDRFTQEDVNDSLVTYQHLGAEVNNDQIILQVSDGMATSEDFALAIEVTPQNDAPLLGNSGPLTVPENTLGSPITSSELSATDDDDDDALLVFTITDFPDQGSLRLFGVDLNVGNDDFTQAERDSGNLRYVHDGTAVPFGNTNTDSFSFALSDGEDVVSGNTFDITITFVDDLPTVVNQAFGVTEHGLTALDDSHWLVVDEESGPADIDLTFHPGALIRGTLEPASGGAPYGDGTVFTQQQISNGDVWYIHDGSEESGAQFTFDVGDGGGADRLTGVVITIGVDPFPDPPDLTNNGLVVDEDGQALIESANLTASDPDTPPLGLLYQVTSLPADGELLVDGLALGMNDTFTQADINSALIAVVYDHLGANNDTDSFGFSLSDGDNTEADTFAISVNQFDESPVLVVSHVNLDEGGSALLSPAELQVTDDETAAGSITYVVEALNTLDGQLVSVDSEGLDTILSVDDTFTQADIDAGDVIRIDHDGSHNIVSLFTLDAVAGTQLIDDLVVVVQATLSNDPPSWETTPDTAGTEDVVWTYAFAAIDEESDPSQLSYSLSPDAPPWLTLNGPAQTLVGTPPVGGLYAFGLEVSDPPPDPQTTTQAIVIDVAHTPDILDVRCRWALGPCDDFWPVWGETICVEVDTDEDISGLGPYDVTVEFDDVASSDQCFIVGPSSVAIDVTVLANGAALTWPTFGVDTRDDWPDGHAVFFGHDFLEPRDELDSMLYHAVELSSNTRDLSVAIVEDNADSDAVSIIENALATQSMDRGRGLGTITGSLGELEDRLYDADAVVIPDQIGLSSAEVLDSALEFSGLLRQFVNVGGVVIVLDGGEGSDTYQFLSVPGLMDVGPPIGPTTGVSVIVPEDPIFREAPAVIDGAEHSATFAIGDPDLSLTHTPDETTAAHRWFGPRGQTVLMGYDFTDTQFEIEQLLANATMMSENPGGLTVPAPVILGFDEFASPQEAARADQGINDQLRSTWSPQIIRFDESDLGARGDLGTLLEGADVFLMYEQESAGPGSIENWGRQWSWDLRRYLHGGGVMVLLDGPSETFRTLQFARLSDVTGLTFVPPTTTATVDISAAPNVDPLVTLLGGGFFITYDAEAFQTEAHRALVHHALVGSDPTVIRQRQPRCAPTEGFEDPMVWPEAWQLLEETTSSFGSVYARDGQWGRYEVGFATLPAPQQVGRTPGESVSAWFYLDTEHYFAGVGFGTDPARDAALTLSLSFEGRLEIVEIQDLADPTENVLASSPALFNGSPDLDEWYRLELEVLPAARPHESGLPPVEGRVWDVDGNPIGSVRWDPTDSAATFPDLLTDFVGPMNFRARQAGVDSIEYCGWWL